MRPFLQTIVGVTGLAAAAAAFAGDPPPVELAVAGDSALAGRLRAELAAAGFVVTSIEGADATGGCDAGSEAPSPRARIVIRRAAGAGAGAPSEVCVLAHPSGELVVREVLRGESTDQNADGVLAVRVVELLRASLLEPGVARPSGAAGATAQATSVAAATVETPSQSGTGGETARRGLLVDLGVGANANLGAGDVAPGLTLTVWWPLGARAALGAGATGPAGAGQISAGSEATDVYVSTLRAGVRYALLGAGRSWTLHAGAGASLVWFNLQGRSAAAGHTTGAANLLVAGPHADLRVTVQVSDRVALYSQLAGTYSIPEPVVAFADREVARLGRPLLAWTFGLECRPVVGASRD